MMRAVLTATIVLGMASSAPAAGTDKTLVSWVTLADKNVRAGSALTIQVHERFDGIVFAEKDPEKWMAGSNFFRRTQKDRSKTARETADSETMVQMAIVYRGNQISVYRNAVLYASYEAENIDLLSSKDNIAVFGLRHVGGNGSIAGSIEDARIYDRALSADEIKTLEPNKPSDIRPCAWWDFEGNTVKDRAGRFVHNKMEGGAKVEGGKLVLGRNAVLVAATKKENAMVSRRGGGPPKFTGPYVPETPAWPANPPNNWLTFHLAHPGPGNAMPGDPNCAFFYKGRYHLHYIYRNRTGFVFAHLTSKDMVYWKWHRTVLAPPNTGHGMFSGTAFFTKEGKPAIIYHGQGSGRNHLAYPLDDDVTGWTKPEAIIPKDDAGREPGMRHWDPDCWLNGDTYYAISGGRDANLLKSPDLKNWKHLGLLLHDDYPADLGVPRNEDISCANMFKIGNKWMLLCISHPLGCRYYLGDFKDEKYLPEFHSMMNWQKSGRHGFFFAPESLLTPDGRRVMWAWLMKGANPTGVQALPRELELPADGVLRIKPLRELEVLRRDGKTEKNITVKDGTVHPLPGITGDALELQVTVASPLPGEFGIDLLGDRNGKEGIRISTGAESRTLKIGSISPPFEPKKDENLVLRVFIDKNLVEVFANDRQAAAFAHGHVREAPNINLFARGGDAAVTEVKAWRMASIYASDADRPSP